MTPSDSLADLPRVLGVHPEDSTDMAGPLLIVIAGLHGNEPGSVHAARRVLVSLAELKPTMYGRIVFLAGNLAALHAGCRAIDRDLNRVWTAAEVADLRASDPELDDSERREQRELLHELEIHLAEPWEHISVLDLHSISAPGAPFSIMGDTLKNRRVAFELGVPVILGLEERVEGTLLSYVAELGHAAVCLEGGQNELTATVDNHEAAIWITAVALGVVAEKDVPRLPEYRRRLRAVASGLPPVVEIRHRHGVEGTRDFRMHDGFANFSPVDAGEVVAEEEHGEDDRRVPVATPIGGLLLMPRYQAEGEDGFFVGRPVRPMWLKLSTLLRRSGLERVLAWMPGVNREPGRERVLLVDTRVARWLVLEVLHLFGYRRASEEGRTLVFIRRREV